MPKVFDRMVKVDIWIGIGTLLSYGLAARTDLYTEMSRTNPPQLLTPTNSRPALSQIQLVATDMDGTLTEKGAFTAELLASFDRLRSHKVNILIVTGRSAGWVSGLVNYLPVVGAIAENGGLYIDRANLEPVILPDIPRLTHHRDRLSSFFNRLKDRYPELIPSVDNPYRITDWTFDIANLDASDLAWMQETCEAQAIGFTYSTVQCHIKIPRQSKAAGLTKVLQQRFPHLTAEQIVTVGDSPNDESLFEEQFPHSVGVANIARYLPTLSESPTYLTANDEAKGFIELVDYLVASKR